MIRRANFADIPALVDLLADAYTRSKYVGRATLDAREARAILTQCIQRHGAKGEGGTNVDVVDAGGEVRGFMVGLLERCYHVAVELMASDLFLVVSEAAPKTAALALIRRYIAWAEANPKVIQVNLSATDAVGDFRRVERAYSRLGCRQSGVIYERAKA